MPLVTVQRSPNGSTSPSLDDGTTDNQGDQVDAKRRSSRSLSECYFAGKGTALVLPAEAQKSSGGRAAGTGAAQGSNIQKHLQSMFYLLRPEETLKMAVKLESDHPGRTRYLVVVSRMGRRAEESCLLGIDCNEKTTVGLVLRVLADTAITLDGDGGFSVGICGRLHIFKPVSVQAMWSALQTLHKASSKAREQNYFQGGLSHDWVGYYEERIASDRSCLNEWDAMDDLESRRPPSPDSLLHVRTKPSATDETERLIRSTLKEIMMTVDLDEVTSKYIRQRLEVELDVDLGGYKSFIDREMLTILGQMDAPTEVFEHVYLGSEWNASNYEELKRNGVRHILNVTREIDNFFPGTFDYLNVRVLDDEKTDLLKHWDNTYKYITRAREQGSKVLVHCKMGISRSASVVIAYAMKAYNWDLHTALKHVKEKRNCIKPNTNFVTQLETYQGMLDAMKNKEKLQRSKSETNLKSQLPGSMPTPLVQALSRSVALEAAVSGQDLRRMGARPKSWSPDLTQAHNDDEVGGAARVLPFRSLDNLVARSTAAATTSTSATSKESLGKTRRCCDAARNVLLPCDNGESYSVSPNQIRHLLGEEDATKTTTTTTTTVKQIVNEFESVKGGKRKLTLSLPNVDVNRKQQQQQQGASEDGGQRSQTTKEMIWDPGDVHAPPPSTGNTASTDNSSCDLKFSVGDEATVWTSTTVLQTNCNGGGGAVSCSNQVPECVTRPRKVTSTTSTLPHSADPFSNQLDRFFEREERRQQRTSMPPLSVCVCVADADDIVTRHTPSRQSSWGSYDSAVGMEVGRENIPSRHSSWGSGDTTSSSSSSGTMRILPSRNSSWGSYDMRPRGPCHYVNERGEKVLHADTTTTGTVTRTKPKLKESGGRVADGELLLMDNQHLRASSSSSSSSSTETLPIVEGVVAAAEAFNLPLIRSGRDRSASATAISAHIAIVKPLAARAAAAPGSGALRLSSSAPEQSTLIAMGRPHETRSRSTSNVIEGAQPAFTVKQHRSLLENRYKETASGEETLTRAGRTRAKTRTKGETTDRSKAGIVRNLKMEFEAKTINTDQLNPPSSNVLVVVVEDAVVAHEEERSKSPLADVSGEDLNVKKLRGKFEADAPTHAHVTLRPRTFHAKTRCNNNNNNTGRFSCIEVATTTEPNPLKLIAGRNGSRTTVEGEFKRPPVAPVAVKNPNPNVVVATVIAKAAKKQQQYGKSHPLARINIKPRHNSPVYNTM